MSERCCNVVTVRKEEEVEAWQCIIDQKCGWRQKVKKKYECMIMGNLQTWGVQIRWWLMRNKNLFYLPNPAFFSVHSEWMSPSPSSMCVCVWQCTPCFTVCVCVFVCVCVVHVCVCVFVCDNKIWWSLYSVCVCVRQLTNLAITVSLLLLWWLLVCRSKCSGTDHFFSDSPGFVFLCKRTPGQAPPLFSRSNLLDCVVVVVDFCVFLFCFLRWSSERGSTVSLT